MAVLSIGAVVLATFAALLALGVVAGVLWLLWRVLKVVLWGLARVLGFARRELVDALQAGGALVTALVTVPLMAVNCTLLRFAAAKHYGRSFVDELKGVGVGVWRVAFGNPLRFLGLGALVDGVEARLPDAIERAPRARRARRATFEGYEVVGTLPSGGSGAQLFIARPKNATHQRFLRAGRGLPGEVVIKSFALQTGSTLPQIVRESRALEAASRLGLVCEHQLTDDQFFYVMPYVKGEDLDRVTRALHARGTPDGLADAELRLALGYGIDLLDSLQRFHSGGLWHKDVKPSNIIVSKGRAHLVDFGLVTPLASALTLTTHGTEYYRDPEMVRLAMQGVKVHEVDGVRFDVYSAGAVLYAMLENSFPAHGSLSRLSRRAPEALRWIVQRAMAEMSSRYPSAAEMRADLAALAASNDPFALRPADLPSFRRASEPVPTFAPVFDLPATRAALRSVPAASAQAPSFSGSRSRRRGVLVGGASALAALAFLSAFSALFFHARARAHGRTHDARVAFSAPARPADTRAWPSLSAHERKLVDLARGVVSDLGTEEPALGEALRKQPDDHDSLGADEAMAGAAAPVEVSRDSRPRSGHSEGLEPDAASSSPISSLPARGRVLVLDDLASSVDRRVLARLSGKLVERGFAVVGQESSRGPGEEPPTDTIEILAQARHALGLGDADEVETQLRLQRFLDQAGALDALILVSRSSNESENLYRVFLRGPRGPETGVLSAMGPGATGPGEH